MALKSKGKEGISVKKIIMIIAGDRAYESAHEWESLEDFYEACPLEGEFPGYAGDGSEGLCAEYLEKEAF